MRLVIVTPSEAFASSGGVRIRYGRLMEAAGAHEVALRSIATLDVAHEEADAYLFTKTYQAAAPAIAYGLAARGKRVALDLFDDYFSMPSTRMQRFRRWLADMGRAVHRVSVSTPALAERVAPHFTEPPVVIADPAPAMDAQRLACRLDRRSLDPHRLSLLWFGIASNPYFEAGLADLATFAGELADPFSRHRLTVLTNAAAAGDAALCALASAPVDIVLREWSLAGEAEALRDHDVAVLPVGEGAFNTAKSLNRATTAICAGAQVLSLGAPIYEALSPFVYRDLASLSADAARGSLRLRPARAAWLAHRLAQVAGAQTGADRLFEMLTTIEPRRRPPHAVVLGQVDEPGLFVRSGAHLVTTALSDRLDGMSGADRIAEAAPPLSGHGVIDLRRITAGIDQAVAELRRRLPGHEVFVAHLPVLAQ